MNIKNPAIYAIIVFAVFVLTACGGQNTSAYETVAPPQIKAGAAVPAPTEAVILIVSGDITITNAGNTLTFDMPTLEKLGLVKYTVTDPWLQTEVTYTGVLLLDLLKVAGAPETTTAVSVVALDGYSADIPVSEIETWPILLATQADGQHLTIDSNGPTRIIFPYDTHPDIAAARNMSVWNIESLEIK
jgi:hypothetical protein